MRSPPRCVTRAELADVLALEAPTVAARLRDPLAPAPEVRSFLHPLMGERDHVCCRLATLGLVELRDAITAMEVDAAALLTLARCLARAAQRELPRDVERALTQTLLAGVLVDLARSPAWIHCDPSTITTARELNARRTATGPWEGSPMDDRNDCKKEAPDAA
jgi:hypothetical protein